MWQNNLLACNNLVLSEEKTLEILQIDSWQVILLKSR